MTYIELLAPARDLATAREAILHGADAVYIGAERFGARAAAGNSVEDISELCSFAHIYKVKVYVTLNTILYDEELEATERLAWQLYEAGVDAFIVQDFALLRMKMPPVPLHASTQMDNRSAEKVRWLKSLGFEQAVLARELSLAEIADIHKAVPEMPLEVFVHGSICVSYNGQCYASQYCFGRSANRGECAQFCRLAFDLEDADGNVLQSQRHLLSLRDMNRSQELEALLDAGAVSLKIEGRLKDIPYVKNTVAYYRQLLDGIFKRRGGEYQRSSVGVETISFVPNLAATFNRGFTDYFLNGRTRNLVNFVTPKSMGEMIGTVKEIRHGAIIVAGLKPFCNGDGVCFIDDNGSLQGFRVNRVDNNKLFPQQMPQGLKPKMRLWRNYDHQFEQQLSHSTAERKIPLHWHLSETPDGFALNGIEFPLKHELARSPQREQIERQLSRLGDTPYVSDGVDIEFTDNWFIPASTLAEWRRAVVDALVSGCSGISGNPGTSEEPANTGYTGKSGLSGTSGKSASPCVPSHLTYLANVANVRAREFFAEQGASEIDMAMEVDSSSAGAQPLLMTCRYCVRYQLGMCLQQDAPAYRGPLFLRSADGKRFALRFDCKNCQMKVFAAFS